MLAYLMPSAVTAPRYCSPLASLDRHRFAPPREPESIMSDSAVRQWTLVLVLTALFLSLVVLAQIVTRYGAAYRAAPQEIIALLDSADSSLQENECYDRDVAKVPCLDDKFRLGRLLGEIQRAGDDLREDLNSVLAQLDDLPASTSSSSSSADSTATLRTPRLRTTARILWAANRTRLEERLRRLDLLRMRFLVVYMSIVAASATAAAEKVEKSVPASPRYSEKSPAYLSAATERLYGAIGRDLPPGASSPSSPPPPPPPPPLGDDWPGSPTTPARHAYSSLLRSSTVPALPDGLLESIRRKPPLRRVSLQGTRPPSSNTPEGSHHNRWMGVMQELQRSPRLHKRHTSVEMSTAR